MAVRPLRPATDRRLGEPLPHQPANRTRAHPLPINLWHSLHVKKMHYEVLLEVSLGYPSVRGRLPTRYSPVRRCPLTHSSEESFVSFPLDLHVLGTPPAFILSQDQTLDKNRISTDFHPFISFLTRTLTFCKYPFLNYCFSEIVVNLVLFRFVHT